MAKFQAASFLLVGLALVAAVPQRDWRQRQQGNFDNIEDGGTGDNRQDWGWPQGQIPEQNLQGGVDKPSTPPPADGVLTVLPATCSCSAPEQYNPVCGSDGNTYQNRQKLSCFARCGSNVSFVRLGVCRRRQDVPT